MNNEVYTCTYYEGCETHAAHRKKTMRTQYFGHLEARLNIRMNRIWSTRHHLIAISQVLIPWSGATIRSQLFFSSDFLCRLFVKSIRSDLVRNSTFRDMMKKRIWKGTDELAA